MSYYVNGVLQDAGYTAPTGTGIPHIVAGAQQAAASLVIDADVHASAGIALSKLAPLRARENIALAGTQHNVALATPSSVLITYVRYTDAGAGDWSGIAGGVAARVVVISSTGGGSLTLNYQDPNSSAGNQFSFPGAANLLIPAGATAALAYDDADGYWRGGLL